MTLTEIRAKSNEELMISFAWVQVRMTHEVNSKRGLTKQTAKEQAWLISEVAKRFDLNEDTLFEGVIR